MPKSVILKTLVCGGEVSLAVLDTTAVAEEARCRHHFSAVATAAFGRTLTASAYLCSWLKGEKSALSVTVKGDGRGGKLCVSGDSALHMRGFAENGGIELPPRADGKLDVGGFVGKKGTLTVISDDGESLPFVGTTELVSGEIAEDFSAYFYASEQRPTAIALGVLVKNNVLGAGGVFLQPLPGASEESLLYCEREIGRFSAISSLIAKKGAEGVLRMLTDVPFETREVLYKCHCSREKAESLVLSMGKKEAEALLKERGSIEVHCHYCNTDYLFTAEDAEKLFGEEG